MDGRERRKHPRIEGEFQVDLLNMGDDPSIAPWEAIVAGTALDISRAGMRLRIPYNVAVGTLMSAIVYYKGMDSVALCEVVWRRENNGESLYGLFIKDWSRLDPALAKRLKELEGVESDPPMSGPSSLKTAFA